MNTAEVIDFAKKTLIEHGHKRAVVGVHSQHKNNVMDYSHNTGEIRSYIFSVSWVASHSELFIKKNVVKSIRKMKRVKK